MILALDFEIHPDNLYERIKRGECVNDTILYSSYRKACYTYIGYVEDLFPTMPMNKVSSKRFIDVFSKEPADQMKIDRGFGMVVAHPIHPDITLSVGDHLFPDIATIMDNHSESSEHDRDLVLDYCFQSEQVPSWNRNLEDSRLDWVVTEDRPNTMNVIRMNGRLLGSLQCR